VIVGVDVFVGVAVSVGAGVNVGEAVGVEVCVSVGVSVGVNVLVGSGVSVGVDVFSGVLVGVSVGPTVAVGDGVYVAVGVPVATVQVRLAGAGSMLPARSVAITSKVWVPSYRLLNVCGEPQFSISSPSIIQMNEATPSLAEKVNVAELLATVPDGPESIVVSGAVLSTVTVPLADMVEFNPESTARAVIDTGPSGLVVESQIIS
jgi:hypothetical protein